MRKNCLKMCGCVCLRIKASRYVVRSACGFTLIELMIVVAIIAILSAIAYPSYQNYIREARRADAKEALLRLQIEQEKWRTNNSAYTATLGTGGLGLQSTSSDGYYTIAITSASAIGYTATATAASGKSQASDTGCTTLTLSIAGGGETKSPAGCW